MGKSSWIPWKGMEDLADEMDRLTRGVARRAGLPGEAGGFWIPAADVVETCDAFVVEVELPGVRRADIVLEVAEGELRIWGERRQLKDVHGGAYQVMERSHGPFARSFGLPRGVDLDGILAVFGNGLLTVTLPRASSRLSGGSRIPIAGD